MTPVHRDPAAGCCLSRNRQVIVVDPHSDANVNDASDFEHARPWPPGLNASSQAAFATVLQIRDLYGLAAAASYGSSSSALCAGKCWRLGWRATKAEHQTRSQGQLRSGKFGWPFLPGASANLINGFDGAAHLHR